MDRCNETQEKIAAGQALSAEQQAHAAGCASCAAVVASYSLLDATLETFAPAMPEVPRGFADRVMGLVAREDLPVRAARWFERRPIQLVVANAAALCAVFNVAWFLVRVFVADVAMGGTP